MHHHQSRPCTLTIICCAVLFASLGTGSDSGWTRHWTRDGDWVLCSTNTGVASNVVEPNFEVRTLEELLADKHAQEPERANAVVVPIATAIAAVASKPRPAKAAAPAKEADAQVSNPAAATATSATKPAAAKHAAAVKPAEEVAATKKAPEQEQAANILHDTPRPPTCNLLSEDLFRTNMDRHIVAVEQLSKTTDPEYHAQGGTWVEVYGVPCKDQWNLGRLLTASRVNGVIYGWTVVWCSAPERLRSMPFDRSIMRIAEPKFCQHCGLTGHPCRDCPEYEQEQRQQQHDACHAQIDDMHVSPMTMTNETEAESVNEIFTH